MSILNKIQKGIDTHTNVCSVALDGFRYGNIISGVCGLFRDCKSISEKHTECECGVFYKGKKQVLPEEVLPEDIPEASGSFEDCLNSEEMYSPTDEIIPPQSDLWVCEMPLPHMLLRDSLIKQENQNNNDI